MTRYAGIIGYPLGHSISPAFQQAGFDSLGLDVRYHRWATSPTDIRQRIEKLRGDDYLGANVTVPHKEAVLDLVDDLEPLARSIGAINTIVNTDGRLAGHNTDAYGLITALKQDIGATLSDMTVLILGGGGAARAAVFGLAREKVGRIVIANRTVPRAVALAAEAEVDVDVSGIGIDGPEFEQAATSADLVVNCTSVGTAHGESEGHTPLPAGLIQSNMVVFDMVYNPTVTPLLEQVARAGATGIGGLAMLVYQGAASFELWTGRSAPADLMFAAAREAMESEQNKPQD